MPIVITFDLSEAAIVERNRIQSMFERLGWENLGGSAYRYPRLGSDQPTEDWFNHVVPALMLFRGAVLASTGTLTKFTIDVQSSTGYNPDTQYGTPPLDATAVTLYGPSNGSFGKGKLEAWLDDNGFPYP